VENDGDSERRFGGIGGEHRDGHRAGGLRPGSAADERHQAEKGVLVHDAYSYLHRALSHNQRVEQPFPESLCHRCLGLKVVKSARSTFLMCLRRPEKYPQQPVVECPDFAPRDIEPR
jgi:hypothetical protein